MTRPIFLLMIDDLISFDVWSEYKDIVQTPNIDAFLSESVNFKAAFADAPLCGPSRNSILTGHHPWKSGIIDNNQEGIPKSGIDARLTKRMKSTHNVVMGGKIEHRAPDIYKSDLADVYLNHEGYRNDPVGDIGGLAYGPVDDKQSDEVLIESVEEYLQTGNLENLFLAAGIYRPHADFQSPPEYHSLYDSLDIPIPESEHVRQAYADIIQPDLFHQLVLDVDQWEELLKAYFAGITFADAMFGRLIAAIESATLSEPPIIILSSDHGYHLGDGERWHKFTVWEPAARTLYAIKDPNVSPKEVFTPVNLSSLYATTLEYANQIVPDGVTPSVKYLIDGQETGDEIAITFVYGSISVRDFSYRFIRYEDGTEELYEIAVDPYNLQNLIQLGTFDPTILSNFQNITDTIYADLENSGTILPQNSLDPLSTDLISLYAHSGGGDFIVPDRVEHVIISDEKQTSVAAEPNRSEPLRVSGSPKDDIVIGGSGNDTVDTGRGNDYITSKQGDDLLISGPGNDTLIGGHGNDTLDGGHGIDLIIGGPGNDHLVGAGGIDSMYGGSGDDLIDGGGGADVIYGGPGNDVIIAGDAADNINGGSGDDIVILTGTRSQWRKEISTSVGLHIIRGPQGRKLIRDVEFLQFDDVTVSISDM